MGGLTQDGNLWFWELVDGEVAAKVQAHSPGKTLCGIAIHPHEVRTAPPRPAAVAHPASCGDLRLIRLRVLMICKIFCHIF